LSTSPEADVLYRPGIMLVFAGIAIMPLSVLRLSPSGNKANGKTRGGGIIIVGPVNTEKFVRSGISDNSQENEERRCLGFF